VNDLFVILSREETAGRVSVIEAEERVDVAYKIGLAKDYMEVWRVARLECFIGDRENFEVDTLIKFEPM